MMDSDPSLKLVRIGGGAGFSGDRIPHALTLLQSCPLDYLVLECLAERTLQERVKAQQVTGCGYDPRLEEWFLTLLPTLCKKPGTKIITNMGGIDPKGAAQAILSVAAGLCLAIKVVAVVETTPPNGDQRQCTYLGANCIVEALQTDPDVVVTGRVADSSLFLGPLVHAFGWSMADYPLLAQGALVGHLLECGAHLTGGFFFHPGAKHPGMTSVQQMADTFYASLSLPWAEVRPDGQTILHKLPGTGGELSLRTCKEQLLYEIGDPQRYITPDLVADFSRVYFEVVGGPTSGIRAHGATGTAAPTHLLQLVDGFPPPTSPSDGGNLLPDRYWKAVAEISYAGRMCVARAQLSAALVMRWYQARKSPHYAEVLHYFVGKNALSMTPLSTLVPDLAAVPAGLSADQGVAIDEVRLRFDGRFSIRADAELLVNEVLALYTNGPAGGAGVSSTITAESALHRRLVSRDQVSWVCLGMQSPDWSPRPPCSDVNRAFVAGPRHDAPLTEEDLVIPLGPPLPLHGTFQLYDLAHSRAGDKGDIVNISLIPYDGNVYPLFLRLITPSFIQQAFQHLILPNTVIHIYPLPLIQAFNIVIEGALDGGVTCSRRIDRHGKSFSDILLSQYITIT